MKLLKFALIVVILATLISEFGESWFRRRRRRRSQPSCSAQSCNVSEWSSWSSCGNTGVETRTRIKTVNQSCGGSCFLDFVDVRIPCNRTCKNGGSQENGFCSCTDGFTGRCCEIGKPFLFIIEIFIRSVR